MANVIPPNSLGSDPEIKLGKKAPKPKGVTFKLSKYTDIDAWARKLNIPKEFGHDNLIAPYAWGMLGNDQYGCCVLSSMAHRHQMWTAMGGERATFDTPTVLRAYSDITGFNPNDPSTDQGTVMSEAAAYNRRVGMRDVQGRVHNVEAYLSIDPGDVIQHYVAMRVFGLVDIGFAFPMSAWNQFRNNQPWRVEKGAEIDGGHCVPVVGKRGWINCVSWGRVQPMSIPFLEKYNDESIVYVEEEILRDGKSPEGFDAKQLRADLAKLH